MRNTVHGGGNAHAQLTVLRWRTPRLFTPTAPGLLVRSPAATKLDKTAATVAGLVKSVDGLAESMRKVNSKVAEDI